MNWMRKLMVAAVLLCCVGLVQGVPITISVTGNVTSASGSSLPDTIREGDIFTGTYTYESSTIDNGQGHYLHNSPYGISIVVGGYEFKTAPNHTGQFEIVIKNDNGNVFGPIGIDSYGSSDVYAVLSRNVSIGCNLSIIWYLWDEAHTALSSDALPVTSPVLTAYNFNIFQIYSLGSGVANISIFGIVTQAVLIPEPATICLLAFGGWIVSRRRVF